MKAKTETKFMPIEVTFTLETFEELQTARTFFGLNSTIPSCFKDFEQQQKMKVFMDVIGNAVRNH